MKVTQIVCRYLIYLFLTFLESWLKTEQQKLEEEEARLEAAKNRNLRSQLQQRVTDQYQLLRAEVDSLDNVKGATGKFIKHRHHLTPIFRNKPDPARGATKTYTRETKIFTNAHARFNEPRNCQSVAAIKRRIRNG